LEGEGGETLRFVGEFDGSFEVFFGVDDASEERRLEGGWGGGEEGEEIDDGIGVAAGDDSRGEVGDKLSLAGVGILPMGIGSEVLEEREFASMGGVEGDLTEEGIGRGRAEDFPSDGGGVGVWQGAEGEEELHLDEGIFFGRKGEDGGEEGSVERLAEKGFGEADGGRADGWVGGSDGGDEGLGVEGVEAAKSPEGVERAEVGLTGGEFFKWGNGGGVGAFDEESLGGIAPPAVGVGEGLDEIDGGSLSEGGAWGEGSGFVDDAKDPSEVERLGKVALRDLVAQISGEEIFVL
jgi:hypothetical protein